MFHVIFVAMSLLPLPALAEIELHDFAVTHGIGARPSVGYGHMINKSDRTQTLVSVTSAQFERVELHTHTMADTVIQMRKVARFAIPANDTTRLAKGGKHLMLFGFRGKDHGAEINLVFTFVDGSTRNISLTPAQRMKRQGMGSQP